MKCFIWETVDKKDLLVVSEYDKKEYISLEFILHEVLVRRTIDKTDLLVMSKNDVKLLASVLPWTPVELAKQYLILILKAVKSFGIDLLTHVEIKIESEIRIGRLRNKRLVRSIQPYKIIIKRGKSTSIYINSWRFTYIRTFVYVQIISKIGQRVIQSCF